MLKYILLSVIDLFSISRSYFIPQTTFRVGILIRKRGATRVQPLRESAIARAQGDVVP